MNCLDTHTKSNTAIHKKQHAFKYLDTFAKKNCLYFQTLIVIFEMILLRPVCFVKNSNVLRLLFH